MQWKVSKEQVKIKPHPNADKLCIIQVGSYQVVSSLDNGYVEGQEVLVMPEHTVIHHEGMRLEEEKYLTGPRRNRVKSVQLRGEVSQGATYPINKLRELYDDRTVDLVEAAECGTDLSELLGMSKYIVEIPANMAGKRAGLPTGIPKKTHDVVQFGAFKDAFDPEEDVIVTEKIHGTQIAITIKPSTKEVFVASKGVNEVSQHLLKDEGNLYWQAILRDEQIIEDACKIDTGFVVLHGEVTMQKGFDYGVPKGTLYLYRMTFLDSVGKLIASVPVTRIKNYLPTANVVPILHTGPLKDIDPYAMAKGKEQVSGKERHIKEGIVITPVHFRKVGNDDLFVKVINPKYKNEDDEVN